jgi:SAM-dependent methyltransferase
VIAGRIAVERSRDVRRRLGRRDGPMGATHQRFDLEGSVGYIDGVFEDYLRYGNLELADLEGRQVLELGPGDNFGVALRFVAAGARVVATDRFIPFRDPAHERAVYEAIVERLPADQAARISSVVAGPGISFDEIPLERLEEVPIEEAPGRLGPGRFDLIVSRAVLEHVHDLDRAFASMDLLLAPGGTMLHKVDLRDHGLFTEGGHNALTFLTIGDRIYGWMGEESAGLPNRELLGYYRRTFERLGYRAEYLVTHLAGVETEVEPHAPLEGFTAPPAVAAGVEEIRSRLLRRYRDLPAGELAIAGFFVRASKPAAVAAGAGSAS